MTDPQSHAVQYRPDIDGLRAVAVLSVLFFHVGLTEFPGGFVGVDIFFVISGFLITSTIDKDLERGTFSFLGFYNRRMRRIFPALFAMCLAWTVILAAVLPPTRFLSFSMELAATAVFASNILFQFKDVDSGGYFAKAANEQFLLHTWSLSVEEQFYVVLPILLFLLRRASRRTKVGTIAALAFSSFVFSVVAVRFNPTMGFYSALSRAWELLLGSLLAIGGAGHFLSGRYRTTFAFSGLVLMTVAIFTYRRATPFPGAAALLPCLGAVLVIGAGQHGDSAPKRWLSSKPMVGVGLFSYSLYLWHWPIIAVTKYLTLGHLSFVLRLAIIVVSMGLAYLSLIVVERPFRVRRRSLSNRRVVAAGCLVSVLVAIVGGAIILDNGIYGRFDQKTRGLIVANEHREREHFDEPCGNFRNAVTTIADMNLCKIGKGTSRNILFWGDSHVEQLVPVVRGLHRDGALQDHDALFAVSSGCLPASTISRTAENFHCAAFSRLALERASAPDVDRVAIGFAGFLPYELGGLCRSESDVCDSPLLPTTAIDLLVEDLKTSIKTLQRQGKKVTLMLPAPFYSEQIPDIEIRRLALGRLNQIFKLEDRLRRDDFTELRAKLIALANSLGVETFDPRASLCVEDHCMYARDGVSIYSDSNHIALSQIEMFRDPLLRAISD